MYERWESAWGDAWVGWGLSRVNEIGVREKKKKKEQKKSSNIVMRTTPGLERTASEHAFFVFRQYDVDGSGGLSGEELKRCLMEYEFGHCFSAQEAELAVQLLSRSGAQEVSYKDFAVWWTQTNRFKLLQWTPDEVEHLLLLRQRFALLDKDRNGSISRAEFRSLHRQLTDDGFELGSLTECMDQIDTDHSNSIDFNEFVVFCKRLNLFRPKAKPKPAATGSSDHRGGGPKSIGDILRSAQEAKAQHQEKTVEQAAAANVAAEEESAPVLSAPAPPVVDPTAPKDEKLERWSNREDPSKYVSKVLEKSGYNVLKAFRKYDTDNSSSISASEFRRLVRDLGYHLTEDEAKLQVKLIATRGGTEIEFGEFKKWWTSQDRLAQFNWDDDELERYHYFDALFSQFDADANGHLDVDEFGKLHQAMVEKGFNLPACDECLRAMDTDGNHKVSFNEFVTFLKDSGVFQYWNVKG